ncbi:lysoplasmalogenase [Pseudomonas sp. Gutcm_11s]|uniref:lysoplasmalogenase n=1 Tax=Pseudomonas sp. Gutcm_11s TaxID=3026088 RepID=UPI00235DFD85|nr:lysoplasmalogenase [Pseudomonas sp. Gutcm_11s]MDD0844189.1 lysoplasmalogenase [Pseudomonas sp. Gutcm_11s]
MRPLLLLVALAGVVLFLLGHQLELPWLRLLSKPLPVICLLIWLHEAPAGAYRRWIGIGLVLSLLGDMLLEWPADLFVFGLGAFLLAHLAYLVAYLGDTRRLAPFDLLIAAAAAGGMFFVLASSGLGQLLLPVALYSLAIGAMLWRALARVGQVASRSAWLAAAGAALFVLSDSLIGINRFVAPFDGARYAIILSYWLGQFGIAASAVVLASRARQEEGASSAPSISRL